MGHSMDASLGVETGSVLRARQAFTRSIWVPQCKYRNRRCTAVRTLCSIVWGHHGPKEKENRRRRHLATPRVQGS